MLSRICILKILLLFLRSHWSKTIWLDWKEGCWQTCLTSCPKSWWDYRKSGGSMLLPCWPSGSGGCEKLKRVVGAKSSKGAWGRRTRYLRRQVGGAAGWLRSRIKPEDTHDMKWHLFFVSHCVLQICIMFLWCARHCEILWREETRHGPLSPGA